MPYTEEYVNHEELHKSLILAGLREIEKHGINGFSLRRIANECGVSCAAPYRHFESKSAFIFAVISYVNAQWALLKDQIAFMFRDDKKRAVTELCVATVLFWKANPNFKHIIMLDDKFLDNEQIKEKNRITDDITDMARECCNSDDAEMTVFLIRSLLYGAAADSGTDTELIRKCADKILAQKNAGSAV